MYDVKGKFFFAKIQFPKLVMVQYFSHLLIFPFIPEHIYAIFLIYVSLFLKVILPCISFTLATCQRSLFKIEHINLKPCSF